MSRIKFMNTEIDNLTMSEALEAIDKLILENRNAFVVTPNAFLFSCGSYCSARKGRGIV